MLTSRRIIFPKSKFQPVLLFTLTQSVSSSSSSSDYTIIGTPCWILLHGLPVPAQLSWSGSGRGDYRPISTRITWMMAQMCVSSGAHFPTLFQHPPLLMIDLWMLWPAQDEQHFQINTFSVSFQSPGSSINLRSDKSFSISFSLANISQLNLTFASNLAITRASQFVDDLINGQREWLALFLACFAIKKLRIDSACCDWVGQSNEFIWYEE